MTKREIEKLRAHLLALNQSMTYAAMADITGISRQWFANFVAGRLNNPTARTLRKLRKLQRMEIDNDKHD